MGRFKYRIHDALAHCEAQGASLALPTNENDNFVISEAFGYHVNEINTVTGEEIFGHMNMWIGAESDLHDDGYKWLTFGDESPLSFTKWTKDQPEKDGVEDYAIIWLGGDNKPYSSDGKGNGYWTDKPDDKHNKNGFI